MTEKKPEAVEDKDLDSASGGGRTPAPPPPPPPPPLIKTGPGTLD